MNIDTTTTAAAAAAAAATATATATNNTYNTYDAYTITIIINRRAMAGTSPMPTTSGTDLHPSKQGVSIL
jgi:hypothetical protein